MIHYTNTNNPIDFPKTEKKVMNERIRELIEQATESKGFLTAGDSVPPLPVKEFNKEKFAELIVRECVKEIEFQYGGGSDQPMDSEWDRAIECASSMVKHRFGVKE